MSRVKIISLTILATRLDHQPHHSGHFAPHSKEDAGYVVGQLLLAVEFGDMGNDAEQGLQLHQTFGDLKHDRLVLEQETLLFGRVKRELDNESIDIIFLLLIFQSPIQNDNGIKTARWARGCAHTHRDRERQIIETKRHGQRDRTQTEREKDREKDR